MTGFTMVPHELFRTTALNSQDKLVLIAILDVGRADMPNRWSVLPIETMSDRTGMSMSTCNRTLKRLDGLGVIKIIRKYNLANQYQVQWDALSTLIEAAELVEIESERPESGSHRPESGSHRPEFKSVRHARNKSVGRSSEKNPLRGEQGGAAPRANRMRGKCVHCGRQVEAGAGKLIRNKPACLDCDHQAWLDEQPIDWDAD